jgi:hypothetical protein
LQTVFLPEIGILVSFSYHNGKAAAFFATPLANPHFLPM